jgi:hypothetical protein
MVAGVALVDLPENLIGIPHAAAVLTSLTFVVIVM